MPLDLYDKRSVDNLLATKLTDAPSDGSQYARQNGAWAVVTGGGGGLTISTLSNAATSTLNSTAPTTGQALTFDGTDLVWATVGGGGGGVAWGGITGTVTDQTDLTTYLGSNYYPLSSNPAGYLTSVPAKTVNSVSGSAGYYLTSTDANNIVHVSGSGGIYLPDDSSYNFPVGTVIIITNDNLGYITITPGGMGVPSINNTSSPATLLSYVVELVKVGSDTWFVA